GTWGNNSLVKGIGAYCLPNGDKYEGQWQNDQMWGRGIYTSRDGKKIEGLWNANQFVSENKAK
ncbi:hypothetical protein ACFLS1_10250, partial [Verrucomicrobiota bacterium]